MNCPLRRKKFIERTDLVKYDNWIPEEGIEENKNDSAGHFGQKFVCRQMQCSAFPKIPWNYLNLQLILGSFLAGLGCIHSHSIFKDLARN